MKLAIVGGGPSGFYLASRILSFISGPRLRVHIFDRLWAPHGLVRYGVAPDHPEVKNCTHKFDTIAADPRFRFFGNVNVGPRTQAGISSAIQLSLHSLFNNYTHVVFAAGCPDSAAHPNLPNSPYCIPALSLVHWYTQHPSSTISPPVPLDTLSHVSVIGHGNVALDIARILLMPPSSLAAYDIPDLVLTSLARSTVRHVSIIGRRGPLEASFTTKELREMITLPGVPMQTIPAELLDFSMDGREQLTRQQSRVLQLFRKGSLPNVNARSGLGEPVVRSWSLEFFRNPTEIVLPSSPSISSTSSFVPREVERPMAELKLAHTEVDPTTKLAMPTGESSVLRTSLVVTSLGFCGAPRSPFWDAKLGRIRTDAHGRVLLTRNEGTEVVPNVYASGWAATGAKGVLASTMMNAYSVAETLLTDFETGAPRSGSLTIGTGAVPLPNVEAYCIEGPPPEVVEGIKKGRITTYHDWKRVDAEELRKGQERGKERERMGWEEASAFLAT